MRCQSVAITLKQIHGAVASWISDYLSADAVNDA
ncbi:hypothetical protein M2426_004050 [Pseudomonas moraviensis]